MADRVLVFMDIGIGFQDRGAFSPGLCPMLQKTVPASGIPGHGYQFHPVAGGEDEAFADIVAKRDNALFRHCRIGQGKTLAHFDRGGSVVQPDKIEFLVHDQGSICLLWWNAA
jgi:hypothetical protein